MEMLCRMMSGLGLRSSVLHRVTIPDQEGAILGENMPNKRSVPNNCKLYWSVQRHTTGVDAASIGRVCCRP